MATKYEPYTKLRKRAFLFSYFRTHFVFRNDRGFTLLEFLISFAIIIIALGALFTVQRDLFSFNAFFEDALSIQRDLEKTVQGMIGEIRAASQADSGAYSLEISNPNSLSFYANIDNDMLKERIHYFLNGTDLKRSVVNPAGNPLTYSTTTAQESLVTVLRNVVASTTAPLFLYYDKNYAGTSSPLTAPFSVDAVRHVRITIVVDESPSQLPPPITVSSNVSIRNLKDNY